MANWVDCSDIIYRSDVDIASNIYWKQIVKLGMCSGGTTLLMLVNDIMQFMQEI